MALEPLRSLSRIALAALLGLIVVLLVQCRPSAYPGDWPRPASSLLSRKGGCPDLAGRYDHVRGELRFLLGPRPDFQQSAGSWAEHVASVTQADDGSWVKVRFELNEAGLRAFREGRPAGKRAGRDDGLDLVRGVDFDCFGGWLYNLHFPAFGGTGDRRSELRFARDRDGGLIADAVIDRQNSFGWGDSPGIDLWRSDDHRWYRWAQRSDAMDGAIRALEDVVISRFSWTHGERNIPTRIENFHLAPLCARLVETYPVASIPVQYHLPPQFSLARGQSHAEPGCPEHWGRFEAMSQMLHQMEVGEQAPSYRFEWRLAARPEAAPTVVEISDVRGLPVIPSGG